MTPRVLVPVVEILTGRRVVATPGAIDSAGFPPDSLVFRIAPDDALVIGDGAIDLSDQDAIIEPDTGWCALRIGEERVLAILARHAAWDPPIERPALVQGMVAGLAAKVFLDGDRSLVIVATPFANELEERLS